MVNTTDIELKVPDTNELKDVKWYTAKEALEILGYDNAKDIFNTGLEKLGLK